MKPFNDIAVYTTIYPGVRPFLPEWNRSINEQSDRNFDLWIGVDQIEHCDFLTTLKFFLKPIFIYAKHGDSPISIRKKALLEICDNYSAVVLVDSDDILYPDRIRTARNFLNNHDLTACALRLIDAKGHSLNHIFTLPPNEDTASILPRQNIFGFSNTAYRTSLLKRCLSIPSQVKVLDWFIASCAWLYQADIHFDQNVHMGYRQYRGNMLKFLPPYEAHQLLTDTKIAKNHFSLLQTIFNEFHSTRLKNKVIDAFQDVSKFYTAILHDDILLSNYINLLNDIAFAPIWWSYIAHPSLKHLWDF